MRPEEEPRIYNPDGTPVGERAGYARPTMRGTTFVAGGASVVLLGCLLMVAVAVAQLVAGYAGIARHLGTGWAVMAALAFILFRFPLPLTVGAFFGARDVWGWHWTAALALALPGLALMIPGLVAGVVRRVRGVGSVFGRSGKA